MENQENIMRANTVVGQPSLWETESEFMKRNMFSRENILRVINEEKKPADALEGELVTRRDSDGRLVFGIMELIAGLQNLQFCVIDDEESIKQIKQALAGTDYIV
ncbi:MAG: hypothetical protein R3B41_03185 [Candidatus Doudnabacteria bacterium]